MRSLPLLFLALFAYSSSAVAQEAPDRFTFVREARTSAVPYPYGDTVLLVGPDEYEYSLDRGKTWTVRQKDTLHNYIMHERQPVIMYTTGKLKDSTFTIHTSYDLGNTFRPQLLPLDMQYAFAVQGYGVGITFDPFDPKRLYGGFGAFVNFIGVVVMTHSTDEGKTWDRIWLPSPPDGFGEQIAITHHARTPGTWLLRTRGTYHAADEGYHITTDYGKSFEEIEDWGEFAGIGYANEGRFFSERSNLNRGFGTFDFYTNARDTLDWMASIFGKGAYRNRDTLRFGINSERYVQGFEPEHGKKAVFYVSFNHRKPVTYETLSSRFYLFYTPDDGQTFEMLWMDSGFAVFPRFDRRLPKLWLRIFKRQEDGSERMTLWTTELATSGIDAAKTFEELEEFDIYPNPSTGNFTLSPNTDETVVFEVLDPVRGLVLKSVVASGQPVEIDLSDAPAGIYLVVSSSGKRTETKLLRLIE